MHKRKKFLPKEEDKGVSGCHIPRKKSRLFFIDELSWKKDLFYHFIIIIKKKVKTIDRWKVAYKLTNIWTVVMYPAGSGTFISCSRWDVAGWRMGAPCSCPPTIGSGWFIFICWLRQRVSRTRLLWFTLPVYTHTRSCYTKGLSRSLFYWISSQFESAIYYRCHAGATANCHTKMVTATGRAGHMVEYPENDKEEKENDEGDDYPNS